MEELLALDAMAAVRFASVYQRFDSPEDYDAFFAQLEEIRRRTPSSDE